jgi:hypothetical protein
MMVIIIGKESYTATKQNTKKWKKKKVQKNKLASHEGIDKLQFKMWFDLFSQENSQTTTTTAQIWSSALQTILHSYYSYYFIIIIFYTFDGIRYKIGKKFQNTDQTSVLIRRKKNITNILILMALEFRFNYCANSNTWELVCNSENRIWKFQTEECCRGKKVEGNTFFLVKLSSGKCVVGGKTHLITNRPMAYFHEFLSKYKENTFG